MTWILTRSGKHLDFADPQPDQIHINDIIIGLSRASRFSGQTVSYHAYTVAQHSVMCSEIVSPEFMLEALMHDASEAYTGDCTRPLKLMLPEFRAVEKRLMAAIRAKFGLPANESPQVKDADNILLATERRDIMPEDADDWPILHNVRPLDQRIRPVAAQRAEQLFSSRLLEIFQQ